MSLVESKHARAIGEKLRAARTHQNISLRALARKVEISASMLSQIENGKAYPSVRSMYAIAAALAVPVDYFFPDPDEHKNGRAIVEQDGQAAGEMTASDMREANLHRAAEGEPDALDAPGRSLPSIVHSIERPTIELKGGVTWARLTAQVEPSAEFLEVNYAPGATSGENMSRHEGREFGLVLAGELVVELGFESYLLRAGDSIIFDSTTPHRLVNKGTLPTRAIWVVLSQQLRI